MIDLPNLLLVGGTTRHVGKTTLICKLIKKYGDDLPIIGLKVTSIYPNDFEKHGNHEQLLEKNFEIIEETDLTGVKDTSKMLLAGARKVFYIQAKDDYLEEAIRVFLKSFNHSELIVCESISIRKIVNPGVFVMIKFNFPHEIKQSALELEPLADCLILTDGKNSIAQNPNIYPENNRWNIS